MREQERLDPSILSRADGVEAEILQEKITTLRRAGEKLEESLAALREFEKERGGGHSAEREALVRSASEALFHYVVQREAIGLRDTDRLLDELDVPADVRLGMGVRERPYTPISCQVHDRLLALATLHRECTLELESFGGTVETVRGVIEDVYSYQRAEYLRLDNGRTVRLDALLSVDGEPVPPA
ncbi:MAG TPA: DUF6665 family protein [Longimicrobiaceae bacterium]